MHNEWKFQREKKKATFRNHIGNSDNDTEFGEV